MGTFYGILRNFGHSYFPGLIEPFRKTRIWLRRLNNIWGQTADLRRIGKKEYNFVSMYSRDTNALEKDYKETCGKKVIKGAIFMCDGKMLHGGNTDRLRGILTLFRECRKRGIPFYINWTYPFNLEDYLVPSGDVDWRIRPEDVVYDKRRAYPVVIMQTSDPQTRLIMRLSFSKALSVETDQLHVYTNSNNGRRNFSKLYKELFKPSLLLQLEIDRHLANIGARFYSYTFRFVSLLGDFKDISTYVLNDNDRETFIQKNILELKELMKGLPAGYRAFITSDSSLFLERIANIDERIYIVGGPVQNVDLNSQKNTDAWLKTFTDQHLIMHAEKVYLLQTGGMYKTFFPEFAAIVGNKPFVYHKF